MSDLTASNTSVTSPLLSPPLHNAKPQHKSHSDHAQGFAVEVAAVYVQDAIGIRKPQARIQEIGTPIRVCHRAFILSPLKAYRFVHNRWFKIFLYFVIWVHLFCVLFAFDDDIWILMVQLGCLLIFFTDAALKLYCHDADFRIGWWQKCLYLVLIIDTVRVLLSFLGLIVPQNKSLSYILNSVRPYYLIYNARLLRDVIKGVVRSIPRIVTLLWLLSSVVLVFTLLGVELFAHIPDSNFNTFEDAMLSLVVLLTTANFPDVMMPVYHASQAYVLYFVLYIIIIIVLLLPTLLAVIYEAYHSQTQRNYAEMTKISRDALRRAFALLTTTPSPSADAALVVTKSCWLQLMHLVRPDLDDYQREVLFTTLRLTEDDLMCHPSAVEERLRSSDATAACGISKQQFMRLCEFVEISFYVSSKVNVAHALVSVQKRIQQYRPQQRRRNHHMCQQWVHAWVTRVRITLLYLFSHPSTENAIDWIVWVHSIVFIGEKYAENIYGSFDGKKACLVIHSTFLILFVVEMALKFYAFGPRTFCRDRFFVFDAALVVIGVVALTVSHTNDSWLQNIRLLRLLRALLKEFPSTRLLLLFLVALMRSFIILLLALFCVFYLFSMIGMAKFEGLIGYAQITRKMQSYPPDSAQHQFWYNHLDASDATQRFYYLNNMNSFLDTLIVLTELAVVNNWQVVMNMYVQMSATHYDRLFFVAFYFCSVIVVLNVLIAFVINLFLLNYGKNMSRNDLLFRYKRYILMSICMHSARDYDQFDLHHWSIERRIRPVLWYQIIFEDRVNSGIERLHRLQQSQAQCNGRGDGGAAPIDYDEVIQMPIANAALIEPFMKSATSHLHSSHMAHTHHEIEPQTALFLTPDLVEQHRNKNNRLMESPMDQLQANDIIGSLKSRTNPQQMSFVTLSAKDML